jgi:hypothetical protein
MNQLTTTNPSDQMKDFFDQLPVPTREKVARGIWYAGLGIAGLAGFLFVMPYVNQALTLGLAGAVLIVKLGVVVGIGGALTYLAMSLWEPYKRWVESLARQTTIAIYGEDPITPLHMWLAEVREDCEVIEASAGDINGIIAENEQTVTDNTNLQKKADELYATAVKHHGENSLEARNAGIEAKGYKDRVDNAIRINGPLKEQYELLFEIAQANRLGEKEAEMSIGTAEMEWRAAIKAEKAMGNAQRSLSHRSARYVDATMAFDIIRQKYAGSFGQLRSLRRLSEAAINKANLSGDLANDEAFQRLRERSQKFLGYTPGVPVPLIESAVPVGTSGNSAADLNLFNKN